MGDFTAAKAKLKEWGRRYLPCETAGTAGEFGAAAAVYATTGSTALAAVAATVGASVGYYAVAFAAALRGAPRDLAHRRAVPRTALASLLALRSVVIEFGPAELIDSIVVRPLAFYLGPALFGHVVAGWIFGKVVSDAAFYACAIVSYERFSALLVRRRPEPRKETARESAATVSAA
jgi:hypothetical protein